MQGDFQICISVPSIPFGESFLILNKKAWNNLLINNIFYISFYFGVI